MSVMDAVARIDTIRMRFEAYLSSSEGTTVTTTAASALSTASTAASAAFSAALAQVAGVSGSATTSTTTGQDIVDAATTYLGVPYVYGGEDASGMDCSGLVQRVLADLGIDAPRVVSQQQYLGTEVGSLADAQPGDLIVTNNADHIVIYAGNGKIIHAPYAGRDVTLADNYLTDADIQTIRRVVPTTTEPASTLFTTAVSTTTSSTTASYVADLIASAQLSLINGTTL